MEFPEAILFDLDGVLLDTEPLLAYAWNETAKEYNHYLSNDNLLQLKGRRRRDCAKKVCKWINKENSIEELLITQKLKVDKQLSKAKPFKGAIDLIKFCINTKLPIALVTSSSSQSFKIKSSSNSWLNLFETKILGDDKFISAGKPSPDPYLRALKILDVNPFKTWVIEDSYAGSVSGLRAGCNLIFFSKDNEILNKLINEFNQEKIQKINELSEIIYYLKLYKGF
ncbi:Predicted phosphatase/phosphohexomutase [Prochlorococcus marinus str. MIT 9515]|uniref:Predicted phosphatase/phosphohexomutase n=1 Tax=Prochlorococcus marinus (strain MIT 9515) TaxID=167542 RepID=A2BYA4_PROM5|nr:HAD family phosphatase [Prochlorococcus marinus]ABM72765.1 Predicted phosphatase/phosphohexomutase [Prochlorococcus marinus str. MIT 9515]